MSISSHIRKRLNERGLSVHALEKQAGLKPSAVHNILYGRSKNPTAHTLQAIAHALDCSISDLINEENREKFLPLKHKSNDELQPNITYKDSAFRNEWNIDLYFECSEAVTQLLKKFRIPLPKDKFLDYVEEVYLYSKGGSNKVDIYFAEWLIKRENT